MATVTLQKKVLEFPQPPQKRRQKAQQIIFNLYSVMLTLLVGILFLCFLYLSEFNAISSQGVIINDLEQERSELIIENEVWNMRIAQLKSLDVIEHQDVVKRMSTIVPAEIEFIDLDKTVNL